MKIKQYFVIGSEEWKTTVKWSLLLGIALGLMVGSKYLLDTL